MSKFSFPWGFFLLETVRMDIFRNTVVSFLIVSLGVFCIEFSLPIALGEFLAGVIGSFFITPDDVPWIAFISDLGLLSIMFVAGFEVDAKILRLHLTRNCLVGAASFGLPFALLIAIGLIVQFPLSETVIMALALSTTSLAIVFTVIKESNLIASLEGQILLGAAMVVDLISMILLGAIFIEYSVTNLIAFVLLIGVILLAKKILIPTFERYKGNRVEIELKIILLLLLALGILAEQAGVHAALIAFLLGIMLSNIDPDHEQIIVKLNTVVFSLLAPLFFFHAGLNIDLQELDVFHVIVMLVVAVMAIGGKYVGSYLGLYLLFQRDKKLSRYGGLLFNYRLSFGIVTAMYAFEREAISTGVYNIILLVIAISSIFTVIMQRRQGEPRLTASEG